MNYIKAGLKEVKEAFSETNLELVARTLKGEPVTDVVNEMAATGQYEPNPADDDSDDEETKIELMNSNSSSRAEDQLLRFHDK